MIKESVKNLCEACSGRLLGNEDNCITDVKIDSREALSGDLFVCVVGEFNDGHRFAESAYQGGCRAFLMSDAACAEETVAAHADASVILAEDTVKAFEQMAEWYLSHFDIKKLAVTGSVGKTTTKMLTAAVMSAGYCTICTKKNLNTNLGLCLTAFMADESTEAIVFEMGMDGKGQIAEDVSFIRPQLAVITNVGVSHMERLGSRDAIADAKLEITGCLKEGDFLIVNGDSDYLRTEEEIRERALNKSAFSVKIVKAPEKIENKGLSGVEFEYEGHLYRLPLIGVHNVIDACLAISAGRVFGISAEAAAKALSEVESTDRRLKVETMGGITLIDDSYNASPDSMKAGLSALAAAEGKRKIAVLSDMYELGDAEEEGHFEVGRAAAQCGIDMLIAVGENSSLYSQGVSSEKNAKTTVIELGTNKSAVDTVLQILQEGDVILVKGSNGTKISVVAEEIRKAYL